MNYLVCFFWIIIHSVGIWQSSWSGGWLQAVSWLKASFPSLEVEKLNLWNSVYGWARHAEPRWACKQADACNCCWIWEFQASFQGEICVTVWGYLRTSEPASKCQRSGDSRSCCHRKVLGWVTIAEGAVILSSSSLRLLGTWQMQMGCRSC